MLTFQKMIDLTKSGLIPFLKGPRGEGKTTYVKDLSKHIGKEKGLIIMNLSAIESTDFCGLPYIDEKNKVTHYAKPSFLEADVLFLDEVDRVRDSAVRNSLLSLLIDRKINGHELNPDCIILTAGNGLGDEADGHTYDTVELDEALSDRLITIDFRYSVEEKLSYLRERYAENMFTKFLEVKPELLKTYSSRRIEAFLKVDNSFCDLFLGKETARLFSHFVQSNLVTLEDLKTGNFDFSALSPISKSSLIVDIVQGFYEVKPAEAKNINKFINQLRAEEKSNYFTKLKKLCLDNPEKFKVKADELNKADMFKGQKEYLVELTK